MNCLSEIAKIEENLIPQSTKGNAASVLFSKLCTVLVDIYEVNHCERHLLVIVDRSDLYMIQTYKIPSDLVSTWFKNLMKPLLLLGLLTYSCNIP